MQSVTSGALSTMHTAYGGCSVYRQTLRERDVRQPLRDEEQAEALLLRPLSSRAMGTGEPRRAPAGPGPQETERPAQTPDQLEAEVRRGGGRDRPAARSTGG